MTAKASWAPNRQSNSRRTVQEEEIERALEALTGHFARVDMAGRTDSGVHAIGQVAAFTVETRLDATTLGRALNARLKAGRSRRRPPRCRGLRSAALGSAKRLSLHHLERTRLRRRCCGTTWHLGGDLNLPAMEQAARTLEGQQDFIACSGPLEAGRASVRTVHRTGWYRQGDTLQFEIEANAFLPQMVRRITGALVSVGRGAVTVEEFADTLALAPGSIGPTAPAHGLCLMHVYYDEGYSP